ncbi:PEP-CTERM sorting domain-containing protein [Adhaeretor mobilis]|uniref:PEP-CTERM protein-sorting domain-containing protein n=1 Tax=Adhaeretor mobilis TaxID=1930276 RepID=A0A517MWN9_9BACT|nr:PEP-CTERM sorting domain-containing protein [Adhaeretor mobilis]QDS99291.1 hypothetical protein HG15A2_26130 [Adhaeretor mobilis]
MNCSRVHKVKGICSFMIGLLLCGAPAWAAIINPADSSTFPYKYEGDAASLATFGTTGYSGSMTGYTLTGDSPSPGILDVAFDTAHATPGLVVFLQSPNWVSDATHADGWTWEASVKLNSGRYTTRIGDENDPHDIIDILDDGRVFSRIAGLLATLPSTTDAQHVYRIAQAENSIGYNAWIDGVLVGEYDAADSGLGTGGNHWWSDGSGSTMGTYEMDYVRFTAGGFSPIPEPATASLLLIGALSLSRLRRR